MTLRAKKAGDRRIEEARMKKARKKYLYSARCGCMSAMGDVVEWSKLQPLRKAAWHGGGVGGLGVRDGNQLIHQIALRRL